MLQYFGADVLACHSERVAIPLGEACDWCGESFTANDNGIIVSHIGDPNKPHTAQHTECFFRQIVGSLGHVTRTCPCYGGTINDPPGMTKRQAAIIAVRASKTLRPHNMTTTNL